jgi:F0F1-type ATP synthase assembly protein I
VYQGAFEAVIALLVAVFVGYWLDGYFDTTPVFLLIGFAVGFASFTVRLVRLGRWVEGAGKEPDSKRAPDKNHRG